jgi:hypothetical protein
MVFFEGGDISVEKGGRAYLEMWVTDDSTSSTGSGGIQSLVLGSFGTGKSTLLARIAKQAIYLERGNKDVFIELAVKNQPIPKHYKIKPTTVLWRCRDQDPWVMLIPQNWKERTGVRGKPVSVFVHESDIDTITFYMYDKDHNPSPIPNMPPVTAYNSADDLVGKIHEGHINVVVEPQTYRFSKRLSDLVKEAKSDYAGKTNIPDNEKDSFNETFNEGKKRPVGRPKAERKIEDYSLHSVKSGFFWIDMTSAVMSLFKNNPILFILDEGDDFLSANSADISWWAISCYTEMLRDFRKANLSTIISSHGFSLLHDSIYKRMTHKILLPGVKPGKNSMIRQASIINNLSRGRFIAEVTNRFFGVAVFSRIPDPIQARIDGLKNTYRALTDEQATKIRRAYQTANMKKTVPDIIDIDTVQNLPMVIPQPEKIVS